VEHEDAEKRRRLMEVRTACVEARDKVAKSVPKFETVPISRPAPDIRFTGNVR